jgi:hypothetical protein
MAMSRSFGGTSLTTSPSIFSDVAAGDILEPRDHAQRRRLAAAGGADQHHELLVGDVEVDAADRFHVAVALDDIPECYACHVNPRQPLVAPAVRPAM